MNAERTIRFGLLCNGPELYAWQLDCVNALLEQGHTLELIVRAPDEAPTRHKRDMSTVFYNRWHKRIDQKIRSKQVHPFPESWSSIETLTPTVTKKGIKELLDDSTVNQIQSKGLDFLLRFGFNILSGHILNAAKHGIWSFHHGNPRYYRGGPPGFWELYRGEPTTGAILQRLNEKLDQGDILVEGQLKTVHHAYADQMDQLLGHSHLWIRAAAARLICGQLNPVTPQQRGKLYRYPKNTVALKAMIRVFFQRMRFYKFRFFRADHWTVGTSPAPQDIDQWIKENKSPEIKWNKPIQDGFLADPFPVEQDLLLVEAYDYNTSKGNIELYQPSSGKRQTVLEKNSHLSYPYTFPFEGETYVLPENYEEEGVNLYRWNSSTEQLELVTELLPKGNWVDPSLVYWEDRFWLFCAAKEPANSTLFAFYSSSLTGPFQAHNMNPLKIDVSSSRPGGHLFVQGNKLLRPAQNCSRRYGGSLKLQQVVQLSPNSFEEFTLKEITPQADSKFNKGIHTLSVQEGQWIWDGKRYTFSWATAKNTLNAKLKKKQHAE